MCDRIRLLNRTVFAPLNEMRLVLLLLLALTPLKLIATANSWSLNSPDGRCSIRAFLGQQGELKYQVFYRAKPVLLPSPLGLVRNDEAFDRGLQLEKAEKPQLRQEQYELSAGANP